MHIATGKVYTTDVDITAARARGEELMPLDAAQQRLLGIGTAKRKQAARRQKKLTRREAQAATALARALDQIGALKP